MSISCSVKSLFSACQKPHELRLSTFASLSQSTQKTVLRNSCMILNVKCGDDIVVMQYRYLGQQL